MPKFTYSAMDEKGKEVRGHVEAADERAAAVKLKETGFFPYQSANIGNGNGCVVPDFRPCRDCHGRRPRERKSVDGDSGSRQPTHEPEAGKHLYPSDVDAARGRHPAVAGLARA